MRIGRTISPAAAPIYPRDIISGIRGFFSGQRELDRFESELKEYFSVSDCFLFSSGKAALAFTLSTLHEINLQRNEVVMPAYVCYSVPSAVVHAGLKVVPCDLKPNTLEMDIAKLAPLLNETTLCVIIPHLFGISAQISKVAELCHKKGIIVIEDAAQAIGVTYNGKMLGTKGDIGFFSLGRGKTISTVEGGILLIKDPLIKSRLRARLIRLDSYNAMDKAILLLKAILLFLFSRPNLYWFPKLFPFLRLGDTIFEPQFPLRKMCGVQAGLARNWRSKLTHFNNQRKANTQRFVKGLSTNAFTSFFRDNGFVPACLRFPLFIKEAKDKERILAESETRGLGIMFTYPDSIDEIPELNNMLYPCNYQEQPNKPKQLNNPTNPTNPTNPLYPESRRMTQHILTLPIHPLVSDHDIQKIVSLVNKIGFNIPQSTI